MHLSRGPRRARPHPRIAVHTLAAPLVLLLILGACSPEPPPAGAPSTPSQGTSSPADEAPAQGTGTPTTPSGSPAPRPADPPSDAPSPTSGPSASPSPTDEPLETEWSAPEDPTAEGPTAAPQLPEVHGPAGEELALPTGVVITLTSVTTTDLTAQTPGEYAGPAVVVVVHVNNASPGSQDLDSAVVSLIADDGEVGIPTWASPYAPLQGEVTSGGSAEGTYVFMLDPAPDRAVTVSVNPSAGEPLAVFAGHTS